MIFADVMAIVFIILGLMLAFPAYWLLWQALFPRHFAGARQRAEQNPVLALVIGVPVGVVSLVISIALFAAPLPIAKVFGAFGLMALFAVAFGGASGLTGLIGARLPSVRDSEQRWRPVLRGGMVLELTWLMPFLGWFVLLPLSLMFGLGCWLLAWTASARRGTPAQAVWPQPGATQPQAPALPPAHPMPGPSQHDAPTAHFPPVEALR